MISAQDRLTGAQPTLVFLVSLSTRYCFRIGSPSIWWIERKVCQPDSPFGSLKHSRPAVALIFLRPLLYLSLFVACFYVFF